MSANTRNKKKKAVKNAEKIQDNNCDEMEIH